MDKHDLKSSDKKLQALVAHSFDVISILNADGKFVFVGPSVKSILGYDPDQLLAIDLFSLLHPEDEPRARDLFGIVLGDSGQAWTDEFRVRHADGAWRNCECVARNFLDEPEVEGIVANLRDITERRKSEHTLAQAAAERNMVLENAQISISQNLNRRVIRADTAFEKMFGWKVADEPGGVDVKLLYADLDEYKVIGDIMARTFPNNGVFEREMLMKRKDGSTFWCRSVGKAVNPNDPSEGSMWLTEDITDRKVAEEELRQAQKMEAVGQLTGGVAHDFNNLFAVIMLSLELIEERIESNPDLDVLVGRALEALKRGQALTQRLLSFSRNKALQPYPCDVNNLVTGMLEIFSRTINAEIEISTELSGELWQVKIDPSQMQDAILNIILNARDALPSGGKITISTENKLSKGTCDSDASCQEQEDFVVVSVTDNGIGIGPESIDHIFEPFFTTKEVGAGRGLGLSMVYGFAKQSGGHVTTESEIGRGTCVSIHLPRQTETENSKIEILTSSEISSGCGENVLVVEDEPEVRELAAETLESLNYNVLQAENGESALTILRGATGIHLILSDVVLPGGMNGVDLVATARECMPDIKCLFMSGYTALPEGSMPDDVPLLNKPFRREELARAVSNALIPNTV